MEYTQELFDKYKACKTDEELLALARENGLELSAEEAELLMQDFAEGEIADEELENVTGGGGCVKPPNPHPCYLWKNIGSVEFAFEIGATVQAFADGCSHHTATCKVTNREARAVYTTTSGASGYPAATILLGYSDYYYLEKAPGTRSVFSNGWHRRNRIEK